MMNNNASMISEKLLFKESLRQKIKEKDWISFVENEAKAPEKHLKPTPSSNRRSSLNAHLMEIIAEEEN